MFWWINRHPIASIILYRRMMKKLTPAQMELFSELLASAKTEEESEAIGGCLAKLLFPEVA